MISSHRILIAEPNVGPLQVGFANRCCYTGALVLGDEALLGAVPMEDMDVLIDLARQQLMLNPESRISPLLRSSSFSPGFASHRPDFLNF